jgi:hypothetical protein
MEWTSKIPADIKPSAIDNFLFQSFNSFVNFPLSQLSFTLRLEAEKLQSTPALLSRARTLLITVPSLPFTDVPNWAVLALALRFSPDLIASLPRDCPAIPRVWSIAQCVAPRCDFGISEWRSLFHPPPISDRLACQAALLLLEFCVRHCAPAEVPPFRSDEFEAVFCLGYCDKRSQVRTLARWILPELVPLIAQSTAAHLVFRRILPYCAMESREGHEMAMHIAEEVIGHQLKFPSCVSTWITMHPFCVAASNNLLVDLQQRGLLTSQIKPLIKQLRNMNKRMLKRKIKLTDEVRRALPRSLWSVQFPPPEADIRQCDATCKKLLASIESKRSIVGPVFMIILVMYAVYIVWG